MTRTCDAVVVGAGISGLATGYHLSRRGLKVLVLDREYAGAGSTSRCIGGIRQQFSTEAAIRLMQEAVRQFRQMEGEFGFPVEYHEGGYLFLAHDEKRLNTFRSILPLQQRLGLKVGILSAEECRRIVPALDPTGLLGGVFSPEDGQAYPFKVLQGYIAGLRRHGSELLPFTAVSAVEREGNAVRGVRTEAGDTISAPLVINAAGPWARDVAAMAGIDLPVFPEVHEAFITDRQPRLFDTMIVDYRPDGCYFYQRTNGQVIGCYSPVPNRPGLGKESTREFLIEMSKRTIRLVPALAKAKVIRHWGGCYENTPDLSPIIDRTPLAGFYAAVGMSGHGFMFGPAVGRYLAEIILDNRYPYDWTEFAFGRDFSRAELMK